MSPVRTAETKKNRNMWPVLGFIMAVSLGAIGLALEQVFKPQILDFLGSRGVFEATLPPNAIPIIFTAAFFIFGLLVSSLVVSIFAPKKTDVIKSSDLVKDRRGKLNHQRESRDRQRNVAREFKNTLNNPKK